MRNLVLTLLTLPFLTTLLAQQPSLYPIDTIEVQTARLPQKIAETGRNISVISSETITSMAFNSLDELLQYLPGVELQSRGGFGVQADISMRGATFTQVLMLIDGVKLNDPLTGHFNGALPVTPAEIERIEVLRGPAAALYGPDAVGGVIHIITKAFAKQTEEKTTIEGVMNYGNNNLINTWQGLSIKKDRLRLVAGLHLNQSEGEKIAGKTIEGSELEPYRTYFDIKTISTALAYQLSDRLLLSARTAYDHRDFNARYFYTTSTFDKSTETTQTWWNQLKLTHLHDNGKTDLNVGYKYNTDEFVFSPDFPSTNEHVTTMLNVQLNHLQRINQQLTIQAGLQLDNRTIESNDRGDHEDLHAGFYTMAAYQPIEPLSINASMRLDYDQNYDLEWTPQLNLAYNLNRLVIRGAVGRSIRAADYTERYVSYNLENLTPGRSLGNPDLVTEQSWSEELGLDAYLTPNWQLKVTGFLRQSDQLIDYVSTLSDDIPSNENLAPGENYFYAQNITEVQTNGVEVESWLTTHWGTTNLSWISGYTYLNTSNEDDVVSVYISSHAKHLVNTSLILSNPLFEVALSGLYKMRDGRAATAIGATLNDEYQLWNLRASWKVVPQLSLSMQVHNLFDESYQNILGAPMPGRWLMGGLRYQL